METERLVIRPWRREEAPRLLDILSREEVMKWLGDGPPVLLRTVGEAHARIDRYNHERNDPPLGVWAVERKSDGLALGTVLLLTLPNDEHGEVEIGWHLHPDSWGQGYATEAARAVLAHGFAAGLPEIIAVAHLGNDPSVNVMRKLGMADRGIVRKWYEEPSRCFVITAEDWAAQASNSA